MFDNDTKIAFSDVKKFLLEFQGESTMQRVKHEILGTEWLIKRKANEIIWKGL